MSKDKNRVKVNMSKVKAMKEKSKSKNDAIVKFKPILLSQNYFFRSNEV